jgi:hypothetical protein
MAWQGARAVALFDRAASTTRTMSVQEIHEALNALAVVSLGSRAT